MESPWRYKAHRIIGILCLDAYRKANGGRKYGSKHKPYHIPELARELLDCLNTNDEENAKSLFLSYEGLKALGYVSE